MSCPPSTASAFLPHSRCGSSLGDHEGSRLERVRVAPSQHRSDGSPHESCEGALSLSIVDSWYTLVGPRGYRHGGRHSGFQRYTPAVP